MDDEEIAKEAECEYVKAHPEYPRTYQAVLEVAHIAVAKARVEERHHEHTYDPTETTDGCCLKCGEDFYDSTVYLKQRIALLKKMLRRAQPYASGFGNRKFYEEIEKVLGEKK